MSGPIVRKYGFPNFDQIFGKRELQHGVEDGPQPSPTLERTSDEAGSGEKADETSGDPARDSSDASKR